MGVSLHLTQSCNLCCSYCYTGAKSPLAMSEQTARQAMDFIFAELQDPQLGVTFFGGEPLLAFERMQSIVSYAKEAPTRPPNKGVIFGINTNGTILTDAIARFIEAESIHVMLSIDGIAEAQDQYRLYSNRKSSFSKVDANLSSFLAICPYLATFTVVNPESVSYLRDSMAFLVDKGVKGLQVTPNHCASWGERDLEALRAAYEGVGDLYIDLYRQDRGVHIGLIDDRLDMGPPAARRKSACNLADSEFSIAPEGTIFPCVQFVSADSIESKKHAIGHVATGWDHEARAAIIQQSKETPSECLECKWHGRCINFCGCVNSRTTGQVNKMSSFTCAHEQILLPIVDRVQETLTLEKNFLFLNKQVHPLLSLH
ncbi:radical SAM protein [Myxococcota bacterium]